MPYTDEKTGQPRWTPEEAAAAGAATRFSAENQPPKHTGPRIETTLKKILAGMSPFDDGDPTAAIAARLVQMAFSPTLESGVGDKKTSQRIKPSLRLSALKEITDRMEGRSTQRQELTGDGGGPIATNAVVNIQIISDGEPLPNSEEDLPEYDNGLKDQPDEFFK